MIGEKKTKRNWERKSEGDPRDPLNPSEPSDDRRPDPRWVVTNGPKEAIPMAWSMISDGLRLVSGE